MVYCVQVSQSVRIHSDASFPASRRKHTWQVVRVAPLFSSSVIILACGCVGMVFGQRLTSTASSSDGDIRDSLRSFTQVYEVVQQNYAEPVNPDKAIYNGAIPGHAARARSALQLLRSQVVRGPARRAARQVLRRGHAGRTAQQQGHRDRALHRRARRIAPAFVPATSLSPSTASPPTT